MIRESITIRPDKPVRERTVPRSVTECKHDYRVLRHNSCRATFYCSKCLDMRTKEL